MWYWGWIVGRESPLCYLPSPETNFCNERLDVEKWQLHFCLLWAWEATLGFSGWALSCGVVCGFVFQGSVHLSSRFFLIFHPYLGRFLSSGIFREIKVWKGLQTKQIMHFAIEFIISHKVKMKVHCLSPWLIGNLSVLGGQRPLNPKHVNTFSAAGGLTCTILGVETRA